MGTPSTDGDAGASGEGSSTQGGKTGNQGSNAGSPSSAGSNLGGAPQQGEEPSNGGRANNTAGTSSTELPDRSQTEGLLDAIGEACESECDQQFELDCAPMNTNTLTCQLSCAAVTTQLGDFCLAEYKDYIACRADGGYDCVSNNPYPRSTCAKEQLAYSQCTQQLGCKRACQLTLELGCNDQSFGSCVEACAQPDPVVQDTSSICPIYFQQIAHCKVQYATACDGEELELPTQCRTAILQVAECVDDRSSGRCEGWCWASEQFGCAPENCADDCAAKKADATCGRDYENLLDCAMRSGNEVTCTEDGLETSSSSCQSYVERYQTCLDTAAAAR